MRVLVTGAGGFIGRHAVAACQARGAEVHVADLADPQLAGTHFHALDLLNGDPAPVLAAAAPTHLLHLAWYAEPGKFWHAPENLDWVAASLRLLRAFAAAGGIRACLTGSCAEYDWAHETLDEAATPLAPSTLYGEAKAALFRLAVAAAPRLGLSLAWGRVFFPYGPGEKSGRLLPDVIDAVAAGRRVATTDGGQVRDFMHVTDVAAALAALLESPVEGAVNIASGDARPLREIVGIAAAHAGNASLIDWGARPRQPGEPPVMRAATARLAAEVGFTPRVSLATGLEAMARERARSADDGTRTGPSVPHDPRGG